MPPFLTIGKSQTIVVSPVKMSAKGNSILVQPASLLLYYYA